MVRDKEREQQRRRRQRRRNTSRPGFLYIPHTDSREIQHDSQFGRVLRDVIWYFGEFLVGAVDRGALATALVRAGQVGEAVPS